MSGTGQGFRGYLQHGTPALINTSGDITVVFSPRTANVTDRRVKMKLSTNESSKIKTLSTNESSQQQSLKHCNSFFFLKKKKKKQQDNQRC